MLKNPYNILMLISFFKSVCLLMISMQVVHSAEIQIVSEQQAIKKKITAVSKGIQSKDADANYTEQNSLFKRGKELLVTIVNSDVLMEARQSNYIITYVKAIAMSISDLFKEENRFSLLQLIITLLLLVGYALFSDYFMKFLGRYLDIHEFILIVGHWTLAYIILYINMEFFNLASELLYISSCMMITYALFDIINFFTQFFNEKYKQQFFLEQTVMTLRSIIICINVILVFQYFINIFQHDQALMINISRGGYQLLSALILCCLIMFILTVKPRVDKILIRYIKQKQKKAINFKQTIIEILIFNILHFVIDIWTWLSISLLSAVCVLWFISMELFALIVKIALSIFLVWSYYIIMRLLQGGVLLYLRGLEIYQRAVFYRLNKSIIPLIKICALCVLIVGLALTWHISIYLLFQKYAGAFVIKIMFALYILVVFWHVCVLMVEYYTFIIWSTAVMLNSGPAIKITSVLIKITATLISIFLFTIILPWFGVTDAEMGKTRETSKNIMAFLGNFTVLFASLSFIAQNTIKDIIAGYLLAIDNVLDLGDVVEIDGRFGIVESLTLFAAKIRVENGALLTVQYGELRRIFNKSRSYCFAIINASVSYDNSVDLVIKSLQDVFNDLKTNHPFGKKIISPIEIRGITKLNGDEMIVQCRFKTKPRFDMPITRLFYIYLKQKFDEYGVVIADPRLVFTGEKKAKLK